MSETENTCIVLSRSREDGIVVYLVDIECGAIQWEVSKGHESVQVATMSVIKEYPPIRTMIVDLSDIGQPITSLGHKEVVQLIKGYDTHGLLYLT
jgi:hypothetical protein